VENGFYNNPVYQWQFNNGSGWNPITGATSPGFSINNIQKSDSGNYRLLVAEPGNINAANCRSVSPEIPVKVFQPVVPVLSGKTLYCEQDTMLLTSNTPAVEYRWTKGTSTTLSATNQLQIPRATTADAGTYSLAIISSGGCSSSNTINVDVQVNPLTRRLPPDTLLCGSATLVVDVQQSGATGYVWNDGLTVPQRQLSAAGLHSVRTSNGVCNRTDTIRITRNNLPAVELGNDTTLCANETLLLNAAHPLADSWLWSNNTTGSMLLVTEPGVYAVQLTNNCGTITDSIRIDYKDCGDIVFVPNAFTPNNDGLNDVLRARAYFGIESFELRVYNRWGQPVFSSNSLANGWDGTLNNQPAAAGLYSWTISYRRNGVRSTQKGWVQLLR
jgi:large repetitive protein